MGDLGVGYTGAISSKNAFTSRLNTANLRKDSKEPCKSQRVKLQKQHNRSFQKTGKKTIDQSRRRTPNASFAIHSSYFEPIKSVVEHASSIDLGSDAVLPSSLHCIANSTKQSIPFISSFVTQIVNCGDSILNHITAQITPGTLEVWIDQTVHGLALAFEDASQIASSSGSLLSAASILITLIFPIIALQSSSSHSPLSVSKLNALKDRMLKLQINGSTTVTAYTHRENFQSDVLPLQYDTEAISDYYGSRPFLVFSRASFIIFECCTLLINILMDKALGKGQQNERLRASQLVNLITLLGPTATKVGQALSIRPDLLPPSYLEELQKLQDTVPPFSSEEARTIICEGLGLALDDVFSEFSEEPIAAASIGQVYKARLRESGETVAVKVQRPNVVGTVCLDLYIIRTVAKELQKLPGHHSTNLLSFIDHWADHFFQELDYTREAKNVEEFRQNMSSLPSVVVPKAITQYSCHKVLTTTWVEGEKLSESKGADAPQLVSVALNCYLIQLLESGFLHADPHPGNLLRTPDGRLCVLDFGLMIKVTEEQRYALIDYISHLVNSDYEDVGADLIKLGFVPPELVNNELVTEILPQLSRVLNQLVKGGGIQQMDIEQIIADLAQMATEHSIVIPPYFAMILRAFSILEGIGLETNPSYAIIDECYPYICQRLLTDDSPRARAALKYFLYGKKSQLDARRVEAILMGFQNFRKTMTPTKGGRKLLPVVRKIDSTARQVLDSLFAPEGSFLQELILAELVRVVDALSREAMLELWNTFVGFALPLSRLIPSPFSLPITAFFGTSPMYILSEEDEEALSLVRQLGRLLGSEINEQTVAEMTGVTSGLFPEFAAGVATASTRFWVMLLHRKALRVADDLDGRNSLVYWNMDPAASARHVRPLAFLAPPKDSSPYYC